MVRKYHNYKPQTTPWHREEEQLTNTRQQEDKLSKVKTKIPTNKESLRCIFHAYKCLNANNCWHFNIYEQALFRAQLSWVWKTFYNLGASQVFKTLVRRQFQYPQSRVCMYTNEDLVKQLYKLNTMYACARFSWMVTINQQY